MLIKLKQFQCFVSVFSRCAAGLTGTERFRCVDPASWTQRVNYLGAEPWMTTTKDQLDAAAEVERLMYLNMIACRVPTLDLFLEHKQYYNNTKWVKKNPPLQFSDIFFPNGWEFLTNFLHTYHMILSTLDYKFLFKYLKLWQSYVVLIATTVRILTFH